MVVDRYGAATAEYPNNVQGASPAPTAATKSIGSAQPQTTAEDTTSFTSSTNAVQALSKTAVETSPSRQAKVEALRQAVQKAEYQFDSAKIAQSIASSEI